MTKSITKHRFLHKKEVTLKKINDALGREGWRRSRDKEDENKRRNEGRYLEKIEENKTF